MTTSAPLRPPVRPGPPRSSSGAPAGATPAPAAGLHRTRHLATGAAWGATLLAAWWTAATLSDLAGARPVDLPALVAVDPVRAAAALLATATHLLVAYLALLTVAAAVARGMRRPSLTRAVTALTLPPLRPVLDAGAGWALALGAVAAPVVPVVAPALHPATPAAAQDGDPGAPPDTPDPDTPAAADPASTTGGAVDSLVTMRRLPDDPSRTSRDDTPAEGAEPDDAAGPSAGADDPVVLRRLPDAAPDATAAGGAAPTTAPTADGPTAEATTPGPEETDGSTAGPAPADTGHAGPGDAGPPPDGSPADGPASGGPTAERAADAAPTDTGGETWTIDAGDHLWLVAVSTLADHGEPDATPARVVEYLERLIDANRDRLVDPADPDLVLPGQVFLLPPLP